MRLDVTLCSSILEYCFDNVDPYIRDNKGNEILAEIKKRRIVLYEELEEKWSEYFRKNRPEYLDVYQGFISDSITSKNDNVKILGELIADDRNFRDDDDEYIELLCKVCLSTQDRILFSDLLEDIRGKLELEKVCLLNNEGIVDGKSENLLNSYRLPILRKRIAKGAVKNSELSNWLSKFLRNEQNITIIDNYIYQNSRNFLQYFLAHIPLGAKIKLITLESGSATEVAIKEKFTNPPYNKWNIEIGVVPDKLEQHARNIFTDNYYMEIEKGMAIFGFDGYTNQSDIAVGYRSMIHDESMPSYREVI